MSSGNLDWIRNVIWEIAEAEVANDLTNGDDFDEGVEAFTDKDEAA